MISKINPKVADVSSVLNYGIVDELVDMDLQNKNKFSFLVSRKLKTNNTERMKKSAIGVGMDILINRLYIESIEINNNTFTSERIDDNQFIKAIEYADEISIEFLEDEKGLVRRYLSEWEDCICYPAKQFGNGIGISDVAGLIDTEKNTFEKIDIEKTGYIFRDDQEYAKRTGMLLLQKANGGIPLYPRVMFYGMVIKNVGSFTIGHTETGNLTYTVSFAVDDVKIPLLI